MKRQQEKTLKLELLESARNCDERNGYKIPEIQFFYDSLADFLKY